MSERSDQQLMEACRAGDSEAFGVLQQRHEPRIRSLLWRMTGEEEAARDLLQETWTRAYGRRKQFRGDSQAGTWLFAIALNLARNWRRNRKRHLSLDEFRGGRPAWQESLAAAGPSPLESLQDLDRKERLRRALDRLPGAQKEVLVLRFLEELGYPEISRLLSKTQPHVRLMVTRALRGLHKEMER
jgi:RNA polymerase sigma-70 factor (ECF subfamily)